MVFILNNLLKNKQMTRKVLYLLFFIISTFNYTFAQFQFSYSGPDTIYVDSNCEAVLDWGHPNNPTVSSTIGAEIDSFYIFSISDDYQMGEVVGAGINTEVTYRATDDQGNADFFTFDIDFIDSIPPVVTVLPADKSFLCSTPEDTINANLISWYNSHAGMVATDNCEEINYWADKTLQETITEFNQSVNDNCGNTRSVVVGFSAFDQYGLSVGDTLEAEFLTFDNVPPQVVSNPTPLDIVCNEDADSLLEAWLDDKGGADVADNCSDSSNIIWHFVWQDNYGGSGIDLVGDKPYSLKAKNYCDYQVNINFVAEDECGNKHAAFYTTYSSHDESVPEFNFMPEDTIVDCSGEIPYPEITAYDECKGDLEVLFSELSNKSDNPDSCDYYSYSLIQTWEANDGCGNLIQHSRTVTVIDTTAPDFDIPLQLTVGCTEVDDLNITGQPDNIVENCSPDIDIQMSDQKVGGGCNYHIFRTWTLSDKCGNFTVKTQDITVSDTIYPVVEHEPSNITLSCDDNVLFEEAFNQWISERGSAQISDNCNKVYSFAAKPGSYTPGQVSTFPGEAVFFDLPDTLQCNNDTVLYYKDVDFVFYDRCFNTLSFTRRFAIVDVIPPVINSCPGDTVIILDENECNSLVNLVMPQATDNCAGKDIEISKHISKQIFSDVQGSYTVPVNPVILEIGPFNPGELNPLELTELKLSFTNLDADDITEYFLILGENGEVLDTTDNTENQCEDLVMDIADKIPFDKFKSWITDGYLTLTLQPNIPDGNGVFAINDICLGSRVTVDLLFKIENPNQLNNYIKIDNGDLIDIGNDTEYITDLTVGQHNIEYFVDDCGKNTVSCTNHIDIIDNQAPELICPEDFSVDLAEDSCEVSLFLPLNFDYNDNCELTFKNQINLPETEEEAFLDFSFNPDFNDFTANSKIFNFNIDNTDFLANAKLTIKLNGDIDEVNEYFEILSEDGVLLGTTSSANSYSNQGDCSTESITVIEIDSSLFNKWATDGTLSFTARPVAETNSINPCDTTVNSDGQNDGISKMFMSLEYENLKTYYYIDGATNYEVSSLGNNPIPPKLSFSGGISNVHYILDDGSGNRDTCKFAIDVLDKQAPKAVCDDYFVLFVNPNGLDSTMIDPMDIGSQSYDNCTIENMWVNPVSFKCSDAGTNQSVVLYVEDNAGLVDSCSINIKVEVAPLQPTYSAGVCFNDSLKLFANLPDAPPNTWTIEWSGPQNFNSNLENPIRPNADAGYSGTYTITVTGLNGCQTSGSVEVAIEDLSQPVVNTSKTKICENEEVLLETNSYSSEVKYYWYEGSYPTGTIVDSTDSPNIMLTPAKGEHYFYVVVKSKNCVSLASISKLIEVLPQPVAMINESFASLCEGETFSMMSESNGQGYSYHWWGPNGFDSNLANPPAVENVKPVDQGTYYLVVSNDICTDTAKIELVVFDKPATPVIDGDKYICEGLPIVLTVENVVNADNYLWFFNGSLYNSQNSNTLLIPEARIEYEGDWSVIVESDNCISDTSQTVQVTVEASLDIQADNDGPVCEGDEVTLFAPPVLNSEFKWTGPDGFQSNVQNPVFIAEKSGEYNLEVISSGGCKYYSQTYVDVKARPRITAISNDAPDCVDGNGCVKFFPSVFPNGVDFDYNWIGPNGFVSHDSIPQICDFDTSGNGIYYLVISDGFCYSDTLFTEINSNSVPVPPQLKVPSSVCEGDTIRLEVTNGNYDENTVFHWLVTPGSGEFKTKKSYFIIPQAHLSNEGKFSVYVENKGCVSDISEELSIDVIPKPNQPFITGTETVCEGGNIKLNTPKVQGAEYIWSGPGFTSNVPNPEIFPATLSNSGIYTVKVVVDGCESILSDGFRVEVIPKPAVPIIQSVNSSYCISGDNAHIKLCIENQRPETEYSWYLKAGNAILLAKSTDRCVDITDFTGFIDGENEIFVIAEKDGCESDYSDIIYLNISKAPDRTAHAGEDQFVCNPEDVFLQAFADPEGEWEAIGSEPVLENSTKAKTKVLNLNYGYNYFVWKLSHGSCLDYSTDTVSIYLEYIPDANDDIYETDYNTPITFFPAENDINTDDTEILFDNISEEKGEIVKNNDGSYTFIPSPSFIGTLQIKYRIYKIECEDNFDNAFVTIKVGEDSDCFGTNVITPNGDGINDNLIFPCLESNAYPENEIIIFNQWGDQVYRDYNYKNDWAGTYNGKDLPVGTYYYVLFLNKDKSNAEKGFFVIER